MKHVIQLVHDNISIVIACSCIFLFFTYFIFRPVFCFKHVRRKKLTYYGDQIFFRHCKTCQENEDNPKVKCGCGWKGRFSDLQLYTYWDDTVSRYYCPGCEIEYKL